MSVDFPNEAARCQRFSSMRAQSNFGAGHRNGPAALRRDGWKAPPTFGAVRSSNEERKLCPCGLDQNTRSKDRFRGIIRPFRAVAQLGRAPGSGPGGRGFKSHQPDSNYYGPRAVAAATGRGFKSHQPDSNYYGPRAVAAATGRGFKSHQLIQLVR